MEYGLFLDGEFVAAKQSTRILSPFDGHEVGICGRAAPADVERALGRAVETAPVMAALPLWRRAEILLAARDLVRDRKSAIARALMEEAGKPIRFAEAEVDRCLDTLAESAAVTRDLRGEILPLDAVAPGEGRMGLLRRVPAGAVSAISPFNFPLNLVAHKLGPAIACGCPVVLKPASQTPFSALMLAEALGDAGLPAGALAVLPCGADVAAPLVDDPRIKVLTFTGSAEVGWALRARAGRKHVALELGGNAAGVVEPNADLPAAAARLALGAYGYAGQSCISVQRVLVHEAVYDRFRDLFLEAVATNIPYGDPADPATVCGPLITAGDADRILAWVRAAASAGARVLAGGEREGSVLAPLVLERVPPEAELSCREAFGPVAVLEPYPTFEAALDRVNDSEFGLQAGVFTDDLDKVMRAWNTLEVGGVIHNDFPTYRVDSMPYGGVKESGVGREGPRYAVEHLTEPRLLVLGPNVPVR